MEILVLEPPKDVLQFGPVRQLQTVDELMAWQEWKYPQEALATSGMALREKRSEYQQMLARFGAIGQGLRYGDPAIFAIFEGGNVASAGSAYQLTTYGQDSHFPGHTPYARIDDAATDSKFINKGLNTAITVARVQWARQHQLPWVQTSIHFSKKASLQAKLNVGFLVYDVYADMVRVVYPLDFNSVSKQGIQPNFSILNGDDIPVSDTSEFVNKLTTAFGVVSSASSRSTGLFVRMIPRDFGRPREI